jgi:hypothetical protein
MSMTLTFHPHPNVHGGRSCNYVSNRTGNNYWLSCVPCNSYADTKAGNEYELMVFVIDRGFLTRLASFTYHRSPTDMELTRDALPVCDGETECHEPNP